MQTTSGMSVDLPSRRARYTWPKPPCPSRRSIRYFSCVSALLIICPIWSRFSLGALRAAAVDVRVVAAVKRVAICKLTSIATGKPRAQRGGSKGRGEQRQRRERWEGEERKGLPA